MTDNLRERLEATLGTAYTIERELGGGGMSRVFVATENSLGRRVVVKVLPTEMSGAQAIDRFRREISIAARLQHAHVVPLLTAGEVGGLPYFTMPFVEGESLRSRIAQHGELPLAEAVRILREVASALAYAHAHDVVHRDIKPDNVLLSGGAAMVTDFGVAKAVDAAVTSAGSGLTSAGMALGTPAYMAPEQAAADPLTDHRADVYAWGVMAYELLTGQSPFAGRTAQAMVAAHMVETPDHVTKRRSNIPKPLADLVMRCLEKRPSDRPQDAGELVRALDAIPTSRGASPATLPNSLRTRRTMIAAVVPVLVVIAAAVSVAQHRTHSAMPASEMTLAVLPIENLGGDSTTEYLADGMTGELSSALKRVPGLQVAGDVSTSRFKKTHADPAEIAKQLGVRMLLTGKLQPGNGRAIRLQMQLSGADGKLLWSNTFDREMKDNFAMQDEITAAIAREMSVVLSPQTLAATRAGRTVSPEAHDLYLRGVSEKNKVSAAGLANAVSYFKQALKLDPDYAQAHAGLAFAYDIQADVYEPSHEYHTLALKEARLAVKADSLLAEGRVLLGFELASANWDFPAALVEMNRAVAMNPKSPDVLFMLATFCYLSGDTRRAVALADSMIALDPLSPLASHLKAEAQLWGGQYEEALKQKAIANKLDPTVVLIDGTEGNALRELGRLDESLAAFLDFTKKNDLPSFGLALTYGRMGGRDDVLKTIHLWDERAKKQWVEPEFVAFAYAGIGDRDHALEWLEKSFRMKTSGIRLFLNWSALPWLPGMNKDPRYVALKQKVLATKFSE